MNVPLLDLTPQNAPLRQNILDAVTQVIDSNRYILGPEVEKLEKSVAKYSGASYGVGVSSGTDALVVSLMALGIGPGDQVLTTPYTFFATMGSIIRLGALPVFVDIDENSMNMDPQKAARALEKDREGKSKIKAIMPVHLYGQSADMGPLLSLGQKYDIPVLEDAAQAIGVTYPLTDSSGTQLRKAGSMGLCGCFSFFPSKNLGGIGDGGMVVTSDADFYEQLKILRNHGASPKYYHAAIGGNFRLDPIQAVVLSVKLPYLDGWHHERRKNAAIYRRLFDQSDLSDHTVQLPASLYEESCSDSESCTTHIYNQFVIRAKKRDKLRGFLQEKSISTEIYYPLCLHQQQCLADQGYEDLSFPVAEKAASETLALPIYPGLSADQLEYVMETITAFYKLES